VFWTIFTVVILFWIIGLGTAFGPGVMPLLLVLITILGLMNFAFRRTSLN
jgi:thiol:disulfide interchange protein